MRIGILGAGMMGGKLGTIFSRAGHEVVFSYARSEQKLKRLARDAGRNARAGTPHAAAKEADGGLRSTSNRTIYRAFCAACCPARVRGRSRPGAGVQV